LKSGNFTNDELLQMMEQHIQKTVSRYKGRVAAWSVVNEPFGSSNTPGNSSFWGDKLGNNPESGTDWIGIAFQVAHAADPNANLFLNDVGIEFGVQKNDAIFGKKSDTIFELVKNLKDQGYPIDGIGFQMHLYGQEFSSPSQREIKMQQLTSQIQRYQGIDLEVRITELDVNMTGILGTAQERRNVQFEIYKAVFDTALKAGVKEFTIFGVRDEESWLISTYGFTDSEPSLFDKQGIKPSYYAVIQSLYEYLP
jgi:endo-1,4-beta-xylanase